MTALPHAPGSRPLLALTQGDPSGIGPEITLAAYAAARADRQIPPFILLADPDLMRRTAKTLHATTGLNVEIALSDPANAADVFNRALPVLPLSAQTVGAPGKPEVGDAPATIEAISRAVDLVFSGAVGAVVTNPIAKEVLYRAGFAHPGHTEFLAALALRHTGVAAPAVMMLWAPELAVVPVTVHIALAQAPLKLTRELIVRTGEIVAADLRRRFGIAAPRLALSGLNPHAGEGGSIGREEIDTIAPAIAELRAKGVLASGPFPADTLFHAAAREKYDAALCMTHDQALIPIKTLAFDRAVNVTLGLPFLRTSPDHGVAFDIAGQGRANPASLIAALRLAARLQSVESAP